MEDTHSNKMKGFSQSRHLLETIVAESFLSIVVLNSQAEVNYMMNIAADSGGGQHVGQQTPRAAAVAPQSWPLPNVACKSERRKLKPQDFVKILNWLELQDNFTMLLGTSQRSAVGAKHPSKKTVFKIMLVVLHSCGFPLEISTGKNLDKY